MTSPDFGLPAERTALAWRRTALSAMANAVLLMKLAAVGSWGWRLTVVVPSCGIVGMAMIAGVCLMRSRTLRAGGDADAELPVLFVAVAAAGIDISVAVTVLLH